MLRKAVLILLLCLLLLSGCGVTRVYVPPEGPSYPVSSATGTATEDRTADAETSAVPARTNGEIFFSEEDTRRMSNTMLSNTFLHDGKTLYGSKHDENGIPCFCRMKYTAGENGIYVRETEILENGVDVRYLILGNKTIYYLRTNWTDGKTAVVRLYTEAETAKPEVLYSGTCDYLFLHGDRLYFTDGDNHLLSVSCTDGTIAQVVADREVFLPYLVSDQILLYQDDADGERLHYRNLDTGTDRALTPGRTYEYVLSGSTLYFSFVEGSEGMTSRLSRLDLNAALAEKDAGVQQAEGTMGTRFCINGDHINGSNFQSVPLKAWNTLQDDQPEKGYTAACQYVAAEFEIFYNYDSNGFIEKALFYEPSVKRAGYFELK